MVFPIIRTNAAKMLSCQIPFPSANQQKETPNSTVSSMKVIMNSQNSTRQFIVPSNNAGLLQVHHWYVIQRIDQVCYHQSKSAKSELYLKTEQKIKRRFEQRHRLCITGHIYGSLCYALPLRRPVRTVFGFQKSMRCDQVSGLCSIDRSIGSSSKMSLSDYLSIVLGGVERHRIMLVAARGWSKWSVRPFFLTSPACPLCVQCVVLIASEFAIEFYKSCR